MSFYAASGQALSFSQLTSLSAKAQKELRGRSSFNKRLTGFSPSKLISDADQALKTPEQVAKACPNVVFYNQDEVVSKTAVSYGLVQHFPNDTTFIPQVVETLTDLTPEQAADIINTATYGMNYVDPGILAQMPASFKINHKTVLPWRAPFSALDATPPNALSSEMRSIVEDSVSAWARFYTLTNGGRAGFFYRLNGQELIARDLLQRYPDRTGVGRSGMDMRQRIQASLRCNQSTKFKISDYASAFNILTSPYRTVVRASDAGAAWNAYANERQQSKVKKADTFIADAYSASLLSDQAKRRDAVNLIRSNSFNIMKPKFEVIETAKITTKVRSIKVANSYLQVQLGMLTTAFAETMSKSNQPTATLPINLYAWTGFRGGMNDVITKIFKSLSDDSFRYVSLFYSDNLFIFDKYNRRFYSLDVAKMESSSTVDEALIATSVMLDHVDMTPGQAQQAGLTHVRRLILAQAGVGAHDVVGCYDDIFFRASGLSTGSPNTFMQNHLRMASAVQEFMTYLKDSPDALEDFYQLTKTKKNPIAIPPTYIVPFDLELAAVDQPEHPLCVPTHPPEVYKTVPTYIPLNQIADFTNRGTVDEDGFSPITRVDLLGFDLVTVNNPSDPAQPYFCACLSWPRVWKTISYRKTEANADMVEKVDQSRVHAVKINLISLGALMTTMWSGGYAYRDTYMVIRMTASLLIQQIHEQCLAIRRVVNTSAVDDPTQSVPMDIVRQEVKTDISTMFFGTADVPLADQTDFDVILESVMVSLLSLLSTQSLETKTAAIMDMLTRKFSIQNLQYPRARVRRQRD